ncbi:hypothetical protein Pcinc_007657 [Petrolisthes cinctipes]|uniref:Uncharacterized protein n=1 Tax=Petrolisthes cinctipes TaxID=88211 RepID=A0AAE1G8Z2_PETCI|nr:hypothetical protein Pcinc_007657 [Petrolisthes cinctipes]
MNEEEDGNDLVVGMVLGLWMVVENHMGLGMVVKDQGLGMENLRAAHKSRSTNFQVRPYHQRPSESMTEPTWTLEDRQPQPFGLETSCAFSSGWSRTFWSYLVAVGCP